VKDLHLSTSNEDKTETVTLKDLFGKKKITKDSKICLKLELRAGSYGSQYAVAKVEVVE